MGFTMSPSRRHGFLKDKLESVLLNSSDEVRYDIDFTASERAYENLTNWTNELAGVRWTWFIRDHWRLEGKGGQVITALDWLRVGRGQF